MTPIYPPGIAPLFHVAPFISRHILVWQAAGIRMFSEHGDSRLVTGRKDSLAHIGGIATCSLRLLTGDVNASTSHNQLGIGLV